MKNKQGDRSKASVTPSSKSPMTKQVKAQHEVSGGPQKKRGRRSITRLRSKSSHSGDECTGKPAKQRKRSPCKSAEPRRAREKQKKSLESSKDNTKPRAKSRSTSKGTPNAKGNQSSTDQSHSIKGQAGNTNTKAAGSKSATKNCSQKKKAPKEPHANQFIDLWSLATIGKREASLNATMKVNILYERQVSPKKASSMASSNSKDLSKAVPDSTSSSLKVCETLPVKKEKSKGNGEKNSRGRDNQASKRKSEKDSKETKKSNKRKVSPYAIYEDEPETKCKKSDSKQSKAKPKKQSKARIKSFVLRHHLGNIIERSPRQASLNAKAMIAMEQEEDIVQECAARTRIYDWTEVRPFIQKEHRNMIWMTGHGDPKYTNMRKRKESSQDREKPSVENAPLTEEPEGDKGIGDINGNLSEDSIQSTMLKAIHEIGDPRLLREYLRSQKEDFQGHVDVEKCPSPKPVEKPTPPPPSPKKKPSPSSKVSAEKSSSKPNEKEKEKTSVPSPKKPEPCRVATPIPQVPADQRATHMTSFVHHPVPQSFYQTVQQSHPQPQPQPIKVTPYSPNPTYIYQYSADRQQQNLFVQSNPSPLQYGVENNDLPQRDYQAPSFSFNHMGSLSLGRRGLNPYHQGNTYSPSIHLPVQAFGFNFHTAQYYQPSLQHIQAQQNLSTLQPVPLQQYPMVQQPMMPPPPLIQNLNQLQTYQSGFSPYVNMNAQHINQDNGCMPPPPPPSNSSPQKESPNPSLMQPTKMISPIGIPPSKCLKTHKSIVGTPNSSFKSPNLSFLPKYTVGASLQKPPKEPSHLSVPNCDSPSGHLKSSFSIPAKHNTSIQVMPLCKKEHDSDQSLPKNQTVQNSNDPVSKGMSHFKVIGDDSPVSDILHSAHSTMFSSDVPTCNEHQHSLNQGQSVTTTLSPSKPSQTSSLVEGERNVRFSVSSILDMPTIKVKTEPFRPSCSKSAIKILQGDQSGASGPTQSGTFLICIPPSHINKPSVQPPLHIRPPEPVEAGPAGQKPEKRGFKDAELRELLNNRDKIIIIDDSDSSDDEPLAKFVQSKTAIPASCQNNKVVEAKVAENTNPQPIVKPTTDPQRGVNITKNKERVSDSGRFTHLQAKKAKDGAVKLSKCNETKLHKTMKPAFKKSLKKTTSLDKVQTSARKGMAKSVMKNAPRKDKIVKGPKLLKKSPVRRKSKTDISSQATSAAVHGWSWIGEGEWRPIPKLSQQKEEPLRKRMCYRAMKHISGEIISVKDCVILQSDGDGNAPYVGKVSALWENQNGDMMFSMLWYYQPEHTSSGRESEDGENELFASKHREENSVACIDDKCYVLKYNEFCRMEAEAVRLAQGLPLPRWRELIPPISESDRIFCRPLPPPDVCLDNIWFCRYDYDIRKKIVRKPKHKKTDLRYRAPCKLV